MEVTKEFINDLRDGLADMLQAEGYAGDVVTTAVDRVILELLLAGNKPRRLSVPDVAPQGKGKKAKTGGASDPSARAKKAWETKRRKAAERSQPQEDGSESDSESHFED